MPAETDAEQQRRLPPDAADEPAVREGGDAACWAHLVCPECGNVVSEGHRDGCSQSTE